MTTSSSNIKRCRFYCTDCFAEVPSECICDRIAGYDASTGYPIVDLTEDEEAYLCSESVSEIQSRETAESTPEGDDMLLHDIDFLYELGDSKIARYDLSLMYDMSLHDIVRLIKLKETKIEPNKF
ncbi:MAG: hypothetical protein WA364_00210 [Candidatus Nitrosopolaris sp.]